jgi:hypothetical protein
MPLFDYEDEILHPHQVKAMTRKPRRKWLKWLFIIAILMIIGAYFVQL